MPATADSKARRVRPPFEPSEPVRLTAEDSARLTEEGRDLRRHLRERIANMEIVVPAGLPVRAR